MRTLTMALCLGALAIGGAAVAAEDAHRELGAHEHGRGSFNMAVEGPRISIDFEVPGTDLVGFEHAATTPAQTAAVEGATARLKDPLALFRLPAAAGCRVAETSVEVESEDHGHDKAPDKPGTDGAKGGGHSAFHAQYVLECAAPGAISSIEFAYFAAFAGARKLSVAIVTPKGQSTFEVTRDKPRLDLTGMM